MLLVRRRDQLVTREDISSELWTDVTVDSEHGINTAIRRIRAALNDDAVSPRYIETVVRRGYRFIAPVTVEESDQTLIQEAPVAVPVAEAFAGGQPRPPSRLKVTAIAAGLAVALSLTVLATGRLILHASTPALKWKPITGPVHLVSRIAADEKNVYWTESTGRGYSAWKAPVDRSSAPAPISIQLADASVMDATPSGRLLLGVPERSGVVEVGAQGVAAPLWELDQTSGAVRRIGRIVAQDATWAPDGQHIAFVTRTNEIWRIDRDGSNLQEVSITNSSVQSLHWSPDGRVLRFTIQPNSEFRYPLWEVAVATGESRPVLPEWPDGSEAFGGTWLANGDFVFGEQRGRGRELWQMTRPGWPVGPHILKQLTNGPIDFFAPVTIPGSKDLAVVGALNHGELVHFDSRSRRFVPFMNGISVAMVDFSRDEKWVTYTTYPQRDLWRSRVDGTEALQLTHGSLRAGLPRISPDGKHVAFTGDYSGREMRTWLVPFDGGEPKPATSLEPGTAELAPTWSADGKKLLFRLDRSIDRHILRILDLESGNIEPVPDSEQKICQRWSRDGKWIAAIPADRKGIEVFNVESRQWTTLTTIYSDFPSWSRNSDWIYFVTRTERGDEAIVRVSLKTHRTEEVASLAGTVRAFNETFGRWAGLTPDDSPLILKSSDLQQIYLLSINR
jgi:Tol biopolymer transport system component